MQILFASLVLEFTAMWCATNAYYFLFAWSILVYFVFYIDALSNDSCNVFPLYCGFFCYCLIIIYSIYSQNIMYFVTHMMVSFIDNLQVLYLVYCDATLRASVVFSIHSVAYICFSILAHIK